MRVIVKENNIFLSLVFVAVLFAAFVLLGDKAFANTAQDAESIGLNSDKTHTFVEFEDEHYYKFIPSATGYYNVEAKNFIQDSTYVTVRDSNGDLLAMTGWDQYKNRVLLACKLTKGRTYFICTECYVSGGEYDDYGGYTPNQQSVVTRVTKHTHTYKVISRYTGGVDEECSVPECNFERFRITAKPTIKKLKKGKKSFKVTWKCNIDCNEGYQIQYSTSSKFKKAKIVAVNWSKTSKKISKLKKRKNYYVRVRAYTKTSQYDGTVTVDYGPWSKAKKVKTK